MWEKLSGSWARCEWCSGRWVTAEWGREGWFGWFSSLPLSVGSIYSCQYTAAASPPPPVGVSWSTTSPSLPLLPTSDPIYRCFLPSPHLTTTTQQPSPPLPPPAKLAGPLQSLSVRIFHSFFFADFEYSNTLRIFLCGVAELGWDYYTISELSRRGRCRGGESCFLPTSSRRVYILYIE